MPPSRHRGVRRLIRRWEARQCWSIQSINGKFGLGRTSRELASSNIHTSTSAARRGHSKLLGERDCLVVIANMLVIERRGGRGGGGASHACTSYRQRPTTLEQGIAYRPEKASRTEARLVHSRSLRDRAIMA